MYEYIVYTHRRRIYTETKANSRRFFLGGKIVCRTKNLWSECAVLCTCCTFPFTFVGGGRGMFYVDLYFKLKVRFNYLIYYFIC